MDGALDAWERAAEELRSTVDRRASEYESGTISNASEFINDLRRSGRAAPHIDEDYWPTIRMTWDGVGAENLEIEIFSDRFEVYRFFDGRTEVRYESREPSTEFPCTLMNEVPTGVASNDG